MNSLSKIIDTFFSHTHLSWDVLSVMVIYKQVMHNWRKPPKHILDTFNIFLESFFTFHLWYNV